MQALLEFAPLLAFIIAYYLGGLYTATAVLMVAMLVLLAVDYLLQRRIPTMHALSAVLVFVLGAATLLFHDKHFIQVKPTALFWLAGLAFLGSFWIGKRTLTERLLGAALQGQVQVSQSVWRRLNVIWVLFYGFLGGLNLVLAYYASERVWVNFKVFGLTIITLVFVALQVMWLSRRAEMEAASQGSGQDGSPTPTAPGVEEPPPV
jgi:intracellular septation protein